MKELLRTNDLVKLSWLEALLADAGIATLVLDGNTSVLQGSQTARRAAKNDPLKPTRLLTEDSRRLSHISYLT